MSPMRPCSSSARSPLSLPTGRKEKTTMTTTKPAGAREPPKRRSFPCMVCGKRFPSQQAMAGHCSAHTRAARRTPTTRQQQQPLPMVVAMQLTVLCPLRPVLFMPPPSRILPMCSLLLLPCSVKGGSDACSTTTQPASAMVDVALRLGASGSGVKRATVMDGGDHGRNKGKDQMDGLDLELRLHR